MALQVMDFFEVVDAQQNSGPSDKGGTGGGVEFRAKGILTSLASVTSPTSVSIDE